MKRFTLYNRAAFEQTPLQVYCSALVFTPIRSVVRRQFATKIPRWIKRGPRVETNWSATLQIFQGHLGAVNAVAFSPDGKQLASGSDDHTVRVWDTVTGATLQILQGHLDVVHSIAFSPDGKQLVSGSGDTTVRIWDAATGVILHVLTGHAEPVCVVAFSPNGKQLVSGSDDSTVRVGTRL
jgi:WD40 repeat protein